MWFWSTSDRVNASAWLLDANTRRFLQIRDLNCAQNNLTLQDYERLLKEPPTWAVLKEQINYAFTDDPPGGEDQFPPRAENGLLSKIVGFRPPANLAQIQLRRIANQLPSRGDPQRVDADIRGVVSALRIVRGENLWRLILRRRAGVAAACLATLLSLVMWVWLWDLPRSNSVNVFYTVTSAVLMLGSLVCIFSWRRVHPRLSDEFLHNVGTSNERAAHAVEGRIYYLRHVVGEIHTAIEREAYGDDIARDDTHRLSTLAQWMDLRCRYLAAYVELEMWRTMRTQAWLRLIEFFLSAATVLVACSGLLVVVVTHLIDAPAYVWGTTLVGAFATTWAFRIISRPVHSPEHAGDGDVMGLRPLLKQGSSSTGLREQTAEATAKLVRNMQVLKNQIPGMKQRLY